MNIPPPRYLTNLFKRVIQGFEAGYSFPTEVLPPEVKKLECKEKV